MEKDISSNSLFPVHHLDDREFFCGDFVVKKNAVESNAGKSASLKAYGVVQSVDHRGRTARVKWFDVENEKKPDGTTGLRWVL